MPASGEPKSEFVVNLFNILLRIFHLTVYLCVLIIACCHANARRERHVNVCQNEVAAYDAATSTVRVFYSVHDNGSKPALRYT